MIQNCYQIPLAVWPHDLLHLLPEMDPAKDWLEVIDRNQEQAI